MTLSITMHCHYAVSHFIHCYPECRYVECRYAECRGATSYNKIRCNENEKKIINNFLLVSWPFQARRDVRGKVSHCLPFRKASKLNNVEHLTEY